MYASSGCGLSFWPFFWNSYVWNLLVRPRQAFISGASNYDQFCLRLGHQQGGLLGEFFLQAGECNLSGGFSPGEHWSPRERPKGICQGLRVLAATFEVFLS